MKEFINIGEDYSYSGVLPSVWYEKAMSTKATKQEKQEEANKREAYELEIKNAKHSLLKKHSLTPSTRKDTSFSFRYEDEDVIKHYDMRIYPSEWAEFEKKSGFKISQFELG